MKELAILLQKIRAGFKQGEDVAVLAPTTGAPSLDIFVIAQDGTEYRENFQLSELHANLADKNFTLDQFIKRANSSLKKQRRT